MKNNLLKKFISFSIGGYINIIIGLLTVPITTRIVSPEQYGVNSLIVTLVNAVGIICYLGLDQGFVRFFYEEKVESRGKLLLKSIFIPVILSFMFIFFSYFFKKRIGFFVLGIESKELIIILGIWIIFIILNRFALLIIRMQQRGKLYSFFQVISKLFEFLLILILFKKFGNDYRTLSFATLGSLVLVTIIAILSERRMWNFEGNLKTNSKELLHYSIPLSLTMALNWLFGSSDKVIIKVFSNTTELGLYSGAFKIIALMTVIQNGFTTFWTPISYEQYLKDPNNTEFFRRITNYLAVVFFTLGIVILSGRDAIIFLLGKKYYDSVFIMPMLVFIPIMYLLSETTMIGIAFKKQTKYFLYISIVVSILNVVGNILLVPKVGAKGAAISTGISYIVFFSLRTYYSEKLIKFKFDLKRIYIIIILLLSYALILTFYKNIFFNLITGILLEIILLFIYFPVLKELYYKYINIFRRDRC